MEANLTKYRPLMSFASIYASLMHDHMAWHFIRTITGQYIQPDQTNLVALISPTLTVHSQFVSNLETATTSLLDYPFFIIGYVNPKSC